jgi:hypothetical protein
MTTFAVGLLLLDGILLLFAGWWSRTWYLAAGGTLLVVASLGVVEYYRRYRAALADLVRAKEMLRGELKELLTPTEPASDESSGPAQ